MRPVSFVGMQAEPTQELRVVIKFVRAPVPQYSRYRLIAYGDEPAWPSDSRSLRELVQRFASAGVPAENRPTETTDDLSLQGQLHRVSEHFFGAWASRQLIALARHCWLLAGKSL